MRWLLLSLFVLTCACSSRDAADGTTWRFAIEETRGSVQDAYAHRFKELVEAKSGGRIKVKIYPYGTLGTSDQITELVHNGSLQFAMASPGFLGKIIPEVQVFLLHYLLSGDQEVNNAALADPQLRSSLDELYRKKNFKFLSLYAEGPMAWTTKSRVRKPSDFGGQKIRIMTSPLLLAAYDAYGASPTPLPYAEVYSALQLNMIDGQANPVFAIEEMSFYEVTDYLIFPGHAEFITSAMTNQDFFDGLSADDQQMLHDVSAELQEYIFEVQKEFNEDRLKRMLEKKPGLEVIRLSEEEQDRFRKASLPVRDIFIEDTGEGGRRILEQVEAAVERAKAKRGSAPAVSN